MSKKTTYTVYVQCSNCDYSGTVEVPYGELNHKVSDIACPNCGCQTLRKRNPPVIPEYPWKQPCRPWVVDKFPPIIPMPSPAKPPEIWCSANSDMHGEISSIIHSLMG